LSMRFRAPLVVFSVPTVLAAAVLALTVLAAGAPAQQAPAPAAKAPPPPPASTLHLAEDIPWRSAGTEFYEQQPRGPKAPEVDRGALIDGAVAEAKPQGKLVLWAVRRIQAQKLPADWLAPARLQRLLRQPEQALDSVQKVLDAAAAKPADGGKPADADGDADAPRPSRAALAAATADARCEQGLILSMMGRLH